MSVSLVSWLGEIKGILIHAQGSNLDSRDRSCRFTMRFFNGLWSEIDTLLVNTMLVGEVPILAQRD